MITCPTCGGTKLLRYGKTAAGKQKYRCVTRHADGRDGECGRQFVSGSDRMIDPAKKAVVQQLLREGVAAGKIARAIPGISRRWIYQLQKRTG